MRQYHKKAWVCSIIISFILFFHTASFAQYESITGVEFKDGSIVYGKVIQMNVYDIQIETEDGKIISRKFNDVVTFFKDTGTDAKQEIKQPPAAEKIVQTENIQGVQFKDYAGVRFNDGSVIYGTIIELNTDKVVILTKDNETITRKFDDIASFIKADEKEESQVKQEKKAIFNIAIGTEKMWGNTAYQIGHPYIDASGTQYTGHFPFSKLEWPLDMCLARLDVGLNIGDSWRINGVLKKNFTNPSDKMKDSDWITPANPSQLDVYSESDISKFDAWIFDIDVEWVFLKRQSWSLYTGLGYEYQIFNYESKLLRQYSPSGLPGWDFNGDGSVSITYDMTYHMPYLKIGTGFIIKNKLTLDGSFAWSPIVKAVDKDHHISRAKTSTGDMNGNAYMINLSATYKFTPSWFLNGGFHYTKIDVDGKQTQTWDNGVPIATITQKSESTQTSVYLTFGYIF